VLRIAVMTYLLLHTFFSSLFILWVRWVQQRGDNVLVVGAVNYIVAAVIAIATCAFTPQPSITFNAIATGSANGCCYFIAYFFLIAAIAWQGAANIAVVGRLSILMPIVMGIFVFGERPGTAHLTGILLACVALIALGKGSSPLQDAKRPAAGYLVVAAFFLIAGSSRVIQSMFKYLCQPAEQTVFLVCAFIVAGISALGLLLWRREIPTGKEWLLGAGLGISNLLQTLFILRSLESLPGYVVFPVTSAGSLLLTTLAAVWFLKERLRFHSYAALAIAIAALALLRPSA
jgi:drug/metabolite transporter (DMT)-like permease